MSEEWRTIDGHPGYEVSDLARVRNACTGSVLRVPIDDKGYYRVHLSSPGTKGTKVRLHRLVALAFLPNPAGLPLVRHLDDVKTNNSLSNLAWGTKRENGRDAVTNGIHPSVAQTHCKYGHEFTPENTKIISGARHCQECRKRYRREQRAKSHAKGLVPGDSRHGTLSGHQDFGCKCDRCREAYRSYRRAYRAKK